MRISDWSSDVCSSDLRCSVRIGFDEAQAHLLHAGADILLHGSRFEPFGLTPLYSMRYGTIPIGSRIGGMADTILDPGMHRPVGAMHGATGILFEGERSEEHTSELQSLMRISYAVFCLKKKKQHQHPSTQ